MRSLTWVARHASMREIKVTMDFDLIAKSRLEQVVKEIVKIALEAVHRQRSDDGNLIVYDIEFLNCFAIVVFEHEGIRS